MADHQHELTIKNDKMTALTLEKDTEIENLNAMIEKKDTQIATLSSKSQLSTVLNQKDAEI